MPVVRKPQEPTHELHGARFTAMVSPSRGSAETSVWQVEVPPGAPSTPHEMTREEVLVITAGRASVRLGEERYEVGPGDTVVVPPDTLFELAAAGDAPVQALVCLPVGGQGRMPDGLVFTPEWAS